jgi:hypothetical protein
MLLLLLRRLGSPRAPAVCIRVRETERSPGGPVRPLERDGCGARESGACVSGAGARAPSDASALDWTSGRYQVSPNEGLLEECLGTRNGVPLLHSESQITLESSFKLDMFFFRKLDLCCLC